MPLKVEAKTYGGPKGRAMAALANTICREIKIAVDSGIMDENEACCVAVSAATDLFRATYGNAQVAFLAEVVSQRISKPLPEVSREWADGKIIKLS